MAESMLRRTNDPNINAKLDVLQTIAARMSWNDLFEKIKNRHFHNSHQDEPVEKPEPWWNR